MPKKKEEFDEEVEKEIFVEFPEVHSYAFDKRGNHIYITFYDTIFEKEYTLMLDAFRFIEWFGSKEIAEIKANTIKKVKEL